jgi:uncharacterized protein (DUF427 family)
MKAIWNNIVLAESNETIIIEGNHYFPHSSLKFEYFKDSETKTICPWKGTASYYNIVANGNVNYDAAWYYPMPKEKAKHIKNFIAFWKGVRITE